MNHKRHCSTRVSGNPPCACDHVDPSGTVTIRYAGTLRHLGIGRAHKNTSVVLLMNSPETIVTTRQSGKILAEHTFNPDKDYQAKK